MAYTACTDKNCAWEALGEDGDVQRAYDSHRKHHKAAKDQISPEVVAPVTPKAPEAK